MVYCGVPSKGCGACRAKRTKCDQGLPSCGQCRRARRICPGYRDAQDLVFRNETKHVVHKAEIARAARNSKSQSPARLEADDFSFSESSSDESLIVRTPPLAYDYVCPEGLLFSAESQATAFFFHHFVLDNVPAPISFMYFLPELYNQESSFGALPGIVTAIGMACIANMQSSPENMLTVRKKHLSVLRTLNATLQDPKQASADSTLLATMLLGMFETVTCSTPQSLKSWANHVHGATAIARVRGPQQIQTEFGRTIFRYLRNQILIDCIQRRKVVPPEVVEWSENAMKFDDRTELLNEQHLFSIIARLCNLRSVSNWGRENSSTAYALAKSIDADLEIWGNHFPEHLLPRPVAVPEGNEDVLSDFYYVYPSIWIVSGYNLYRSGRILSLELIQHFLARNTSYDVDHKLRREIGCSLSRLREEICASVPYILGNTEDSKSSAYEARAAQVIPLIWPLYLAAAMDDSPPETRAWAIRQFETIGRRFGIEQATSLSNVLRVKREITAWDHFDETRLDEELREW